MRIISTSIEKKAGRPERHETYGKDNYSENPQQFPILSEQPCGFIKVPARQVKNSAVLPIKTPKHAKTNNHRCLVFYEHRKGSSNKNE
jgi:hypothetical protein